MARANLSLSPAISAAFLAAQEDFSMRALKIGIVGEEMTLTATVMKVHEVEDDFNVTLREHLVANDASMILFRITDEITPAGSKWLLFSWVPDGCRVRDKMLYSSSREDLKRSLGIGYFSSEYFATSFAEVSWEQVEAYRSRDTNAVFLSEKERLIIEEKSLAYGESNVTKSSAMTVLPIPATDEAVDHLRRFDRKEFNWVELQLGTGEGKEECIHLVSASLLAPESRTQPLITAADARFFLFRPAISDEDTAVFVYSCPEATPIRKKMTMSSTKASVLAVAAELGITFVKTTEIRSPEELDEYVQSEFKAAVDTSGGASSASASINYAKPTRPGRGKAKQTKFKADADESEN